MAFYAENLRTRTRHIREEAEESGIEREDEAAELVAVSKSKSLTLELVPSCVPPSLREDWPALLRLREEERIFSLPEEDAVTHGWPASSFVAETSEKLALHLGWILKGKGKGKQSKRARKRLQENERERWRAQEKCPLPLCYKAVIKLHKLSPFSLLLSFFRQTFMPLHIVCRPNLSALFAQKTQAIYWSLSLQWLLQLSLPWMMILLFLGCCYCCWMTQ